MDVLPGTSARLSALVTLYVHTDQWRRQLLCSCARRQFHGQGTRRVSLGAMPRWWRTISRHRPASRDKFLRVFDYCCSLCNASENSISSQQWTFQIAKIHVIISTACATLPVGSPLYPSFIPLLLFLILPFLYSFLLHNCAKICSLVTRYSITFLC